MRHRVELLAPFLLLALFTLPDCAGEIAASPDAGADAQAPGPTPTPTPGADAGGGADTCTPESHRATPTACAATVPPLPDSGAPPSCATDTDCAASGSGAEWCRHGTCAFDACLVDDDCGPGAACSCAADYYGGNALYHPNVCVEATCRVDSDCGPGALCAPSVGACGVRVSFRCVSANAGTCTAPNSACDYAAEVGHFTCAASQTCGG